MQYLPRRTGYISIDKSEIVLILRGIFIWRLLRIQTIG